MNTLRDKGRGGEEKIKMNQNQVLNAYAAYSINKFERHDSSSGGLFSLLAKSVLSEGGLVYGVAMSSDCKRAEFARVAKESDLRCLRGSKYLQAHVGQTFKSVKDDLDFGKAVLFSGTGCQVNALKQFLCGGKYDANAFEEKYPNLYCVDVICHGAPSPALWKEYVKHIEKQNDAKLVSINFRCKDDSWNDFGMKLINEKHKELYISKDKDPYMIMFLRDYCLRPSCYECKAKELKLSDITLADFWGIDNVVPEMNDGKGTSLILVRTNKGKQLFQEITSQLKIKEVSYEEGVVGNPSEYKSVTRPPERNMFFDDMHSLSFEELKGKYGTPKPISIKRKIKSFIKRALIKARILRGGGGLTNDSYGLQFRFQTRDE